MIAEPVMGAGGVMPPPQGYWAKLAAMLRRHDILLIADEVVTGFGRLGTLLGCHRLDIEPDMITLAKGISSAYLPMGAVLLRSAVSEHIAAVTDAQPIGHGMTYSGHPVCAAVAK